MPSSNGISPSGFVICGRSGATAAPSFGAARACGRRGSGRTVPARRTTGIAGPMSSGWRRRWTWWKIGDRRSRTVKEQQVMDMKLELVVLPVADVDRAKAFYVDRLGFHLDVDHQPNEQFRVVQMTPPGSACSITVGVGLGLGQGESGPVKGLHLVVADIEAAHAHLVEHGVE